ncbi:MAG: chromate transporter [Rectinema sp.]
MNSARDTAKNAPTALRLFGLFAGISAVTIGGGYAIVPVIGNALEKRGWMDEKEFYDLFARAQAFPGPLALTTAVLCSIKLAGFRGAIAAFLGVIVPPFFALILVGSLLGRFGSLPAVRRFLDGAGATVPGLVAAMVWRNAKKRKWTAFRAVSTIALAVALALLPGMSMPILLGGILLLYVSEAAWKS